MDRKKHSAEEFVFSVPKRKRREKSADDLLAAMGGIVGSLPPGFSPPEDPP